MPLFAEVFWFVFLLIGFGLFCCIAVPVLLFMFRRKENPGRWMIGGLILTPVAYCLLLYGYHSWTTRGSVVFKEAFGFTPTDDVVIHESDKSDFLDSKGLSLTFTADEKTVDRIISFRFETKLSRSAPHPDGRYCFSRDFDNSTRVGHEELIYDPKTTLTTYSWSELF